MSAVGDARKRQVERPAIEGAIVERDTRRLAQGMVESTTEYDFAELPAELRGALIDWCDAFAAWDGGQR